MAAAVHAMTYLLAGWRNQRVFTAGIATSKNGRTTGGEKSMADHGEWTMLKRVYNTIQTTKAAFARSLATCLTTVGVAQISSRPKSGTKRKQRTL